MSFLRVFAPAAALTLIACASFPAVPASSSLESDLWIVDAGPAGSFQAISGAFEVPAVRDDPSAGVFTLQYIRLLSTATEPAAPVVYLAGGPGDAATPIAEQPFAVAALASWLETADVVLLDQRGVGASGPDTSVSNDEHIPRDFFVDEQSALEHRMTIDAAARTILESRGVPLAGLTVQESADDVEALRRHLGLDRVSLYGFSYGTHLALSVIRRHPDSVERAVLVGTEGPDHTLKPPLSLDERLHDLAQLAAISPELSGEEDLVAVFDRVSARLDQEPVLVSVRPPAGQAMSVPVGAFGLHLIMRHDIGDATDLPVFPRLLYALDRGDTAMLGWFVQRRSFWLTETSAHLFMTDGSSGGSPDRLSMVARDREISGFGNAANFPLPDIIDVWSPPPVDPDYHDPVRSDVPVLFVSGALDWNAPAAQAEEVRRGFPNSAHVIVENAGHEQIIQNGQARSMIAAFWRGQPLEDAMVSNPPLQFAPADGPTSVRHPALGGE